ncbi:CcdC protein domain-containing protein [Phenylobacterium sp.]|uniref:CcdC protein domain-containing protein n=1 Tax=Phenylobacterium sp. TaxID=1871053 RepID=UPI0025CE0218|nr:CcdC protein domain-containing protein [Phenylobacterium sp.]
MDQVPPGAGVWTYLAPIIIIGVVILRNSRARTLRIERLWVTPAIVMAMTLLAFSQSPPPGPLGIALDVGAVAVGGFLGWWRGRASHFTVNPGTHVVTSRVSAWGMLLILGIFALRYIVRYALQGEASTLHISANDLADSFLVLAVGVVSAQRIEWLIRARKLIAGARLP